MNKISLQIIEELTTYNDADFKVLQGRLSLGMYGSAVSQEVAQHVADDSQRRKLNDSDATLPEVSPTWEVDLELKHKMNMKEIASRLNNGDWEPLYYATEKQIDTLIEQGRIEEDFYCRYQDYQEEVRCMMDEF